MDWKEQLDKEFDFHNSNYLNWRDKLYPEIKHFISTEIIEKLIDEMPDNVTNSDFGEFLAWSKQQLRDKWL